MTAATEPLPRLLLSLTEAAEQVGVSVKTLRRAIAEAGPHRLRASKVRGMWRISPTELQRWIDRYALRGVRR